MLLILKKKTIYIIVNECLFLKINLNYGFMEYSYLNAPLAQLVRASVL